MAEERNYLLFNEFIEEAYDIPDEYGMTQMLQRSIGCYARCVLGAGSEVDGYIQYAGKEHVVLCSEQCDMHALIRLETILYICIWGQRKKTTFQYDAMGAKPAETPPPAADKGQARPNARMSSSRTPRKRY